MSESGSTMLLHSVVIGLLLYIFMVYILKQDTLVAQDRSIFYAAIILIYMILFGHGLPTTPNKNII
jgi:hypothetical protein